MKESRRSRSSDNGKRSSASRRTVLKGIAAGVGAAAGSGVIGGFPVVWSQNIKDITIRQIGFTTTNNKILERKVNEDLGFKVVLEGVDGNTLVNRSVSQPRSFDITAPGYESTEVFLATGHYQPIDVGRINLWDKVVPVFKTGKLDDNAKFGQGMNVSRHQFVDGPDSNTTVARETQWATALPMLHNADTLGIRPDLIGREIESWAELINPEFTGRAGLANYAATALLEAGAAFQAAGQIDYGDLGEMTQPEIDRTIDALIDLKKKGHWRAFWGTFSESINLMASGEVVIQSMWAPAVTAVRAQGLECSYVPLKEGYRCWSGGLMLNKAISGLKLEATYEYLNWNFDSGVPGSFFARQGYYPPVLDTAKPLMTENEWNFWIEGKPATADIVDPYGNTIEKPGAVREGGSYWERFGNVLVWNSQMKENAHVVRRWNEFLSA